MVNEKMKNLGEQSSAIRELFEYGLARKKEIGEKNVFDFSLGNPNVDTPKIVNDKLIEILNTDNSILLHSYTSSPGNIETRNSIANNLNKRFSCHEDGKYIYLTHGAAASLTIAFNGLLNPGDEVILFAPYFPEYKVFIEKAQGKVIIVEPDKNFMPNFLDLENKISRRTKIVVINSPNNPTGVVYDDNVIKKISEILKKKEDEFNNQIFLLSDEPYRELIYNDIEYPFISNYYDDSLICYSFSKSLSLPGERIGYLLVSNRCKNVDDVFSSIKGAGRALGFVCATSLFQKLIPFVLDLTSDLSIYKKNREFLYENLTKMGYEVIYPNGAFYMFVKALEEDDEKFSQEAKKEELLLVPSSSFGIKGYVRVSYCVEYQTIKNSLTAFEKLIKRYKGV